jgi:hypothetical protein
MSRPYASSEYVPSACIGAFCTHLAVSRSGRWFYGRRQGWSRVTVCAYGLAGVARFGERPDGVSMARRYTASLVASAMSYLGLPRYLRHAHLFIINCPCLCYITLPLFGHRSRCLYGVVALFCSWPKPIGPVLVPCRGCRWTMLENLLSTAVVLFVGYILIEGIARWMLDRRHSRSPPKDQG